MLAWNKSVSLEGGKKRSLQRDGKVHSVQPAPLCRVGTFVNDFMTNLQPDVTD